MPALRIYGRRTLLGGDDLQLGCLVTISARIFQVFILLLPVLIHLLREGQKYGLLSYLFQPIHDTYECRNSYLFPMSTFLYCLVSAFYFSLSLFFERRLWKASSIGAPTQPHLRNEEVVRLMEWKTIPLNTFLFLNFGLGIFAIFQSKLFYYCLREHEDELQSIQSDNSNISQNQFLLESSTSATTSTWWIFLLVLLLSQAMEVMYSIFSLVRLFNNPKGVNTHPTLEEFVRSGGDHTLYTENFHHHEQDHMGLYDAMWEERCKFWCKCSGQATCFLFGGQEVGSGDYTDISRILTDYFEHGGMLDIVPSDIAAAFIVLQKIQKQRTLTCRKNINESKRSVLEAVESFKIQTAERSINPADIDLLFNNSKSTIMENAPTNDINLSRHSSTDTPFFTPAKDVDNKLRATNLELSPLQVCDSSETWKMNEPLILIRDRRTDREKIGEAARFARHALAIYTWMMYVYMKPMCGFCELTCVGCQQRKKCKLSFTDDKQTNDEGNHEHENNSFYRAPPSESMSRNREPPSIKGDIFCELHKKALLKQAGLNDTDLVYAQFQSGLKETPYCIVIDHKWKSVVLAIRGTLSLEDCVMDVLVGAKPLDELGREYGFDGDGEFIHSGVLETTEWIMNDLKTHKKLESLLLGPTAQYPIYKLRIVGHSLGAGCATLISLMLRQTYPSLKCHAFSPPGGFCTKRTALACKEFVTSYVLDADLVPRLSIENMQKLRNEILSLIGRIRVPKVKVLRSIFHPDVDESIKALLYPEDMLPSDTDYAIQLNQFKRIQQDRKQHRGSTDVSMYPPGKIIHMVRTTETNSFFSRLRPNRAIGICKTTVPIESKYTPCWVDNEDFDEIVVTPSMGTDHFQSNVCLELEKIAMDFGLDAHDGFLEDKSSVENWYAANDLEMQS